MSPYGLHSEGPSACLPWCCFIFPSKQMLLYLPPSFTHFYSSFSASFLFSFPSASHFTFLLWRELCVVSYLPPVAFKVFLSAKHPIHCHRNRKLSVEEKKRKEVWESEALQFCYFAQIHKWQHAGRYAKACCLRQQGKEGPPISRKLSQLLNPG